MNPWGIMQRFGPATGGGPVDPTAAAILAKLTSWWEMGEATGTRYDSKGANNLSVLGTVATGTGVRGSGDVAAAFAGAGGLSAANNASIQVPPGGGSHSIFGWVYVNSNTGTQAFCSKWLNTTDTAKGIEYHCNSNAGIYSATNGGSVTYYTVSVSSAISAGAWHFYIMWRDPADGKLRLQVDNGTVFVSASATDPATNAANLIFAQLTSGAEKLTGRLQRWGWIKGAILTADERAWLFNSGTGRTYAEIRAAAGM